MPPPPSDVDERSLTPEVPLWRDINTPPPSPPTISLLSSDGVRFSSVPLSVARGARVLGPALESVATSSSSHIPIPGVRARPLAGVLDFLSASAALEGELAWRKRRAVPRPPGGEPGAAAAHAAWAKGWAAAMPGPDLIALAAAASYLDVPALLALATTALATRLTSQGPAGLRAEFALPDDLSPADAAAIRADCAGAFDPPGW